MNRIAINFTHIGMVHHLQELVERVHVVMKFDRQRIFSKEDRDGVINVAFVESILLGVSEGGDRLDF